MNNTEIAFFTLAFLLPLVGGGTLLYLVTRDSKSEPKAQRKDDGGDGDQRPKNPE